MKNAYCLFLDFRVALLDDVYKQIKANNMSTTAVVNEAQQGPPFRRIDATQINLENDDEVGVASGYAIQHPIPSGFVPPQNHANNIGYDHSHSLPVAGNKAGLYIRIKNTTPILTIHL